MFEAFLEIVEVNKANAQTVDNKSSRVVRISLDGGIVICWEFDKSIVVRDKKVIVEYLDELAFFVSGELLLCQILNYL